MITGVKSIQKYILLNRTNLVGIDWFVGLEMTSANQSPNLIV